MSPALSLLSLALTAAPPPMLRVPFDAATAASSREAWAKATGQPAEFTNSVGMRLVLIPPGRFTAGPNGSTHRIAITKPFHAGITEVTLGQYRRFKTGHAVPGAADEFNADDRPAAAVSWNDAREFCRWLSDRPEEKTAGRVYSLPTEAQWEWAARGGTAGPKYFGEDPKARDKGLTDHAWFNHTYTPNPKSESNGRGRQPVGKLQPNPWGLHDVFGNVWEWCDDRRENAVTGEVYEPVMRGGSWRSGGSHCTAYAHDPGDPKLVGDHIGFRVVCRIETRER